MLTYKQAGVDIEVGNAFVQRLKRLCPEIGGFSGLYPLGDQLLVASADGVGTKLRLACSQDQHDTVGIDLVAMGVNDILTTGARPLFFLDYFATSHLDVDQAERVVRGIVHGCKQAGCLLLGGETAEMPGFYAHGEYDLAGFAVGIVAKKELIDGRSIQPGDLLVGIASNGLHSNGFSLVRKILERIQPSAQQWRDLLQPTCIYVSKVFSILERFVIKGMAHITGGGFIDNIPRMLPRGLAARIDRSSWQVPPLFRWLQNAGGVDEEEMFRTWNMGIGMVLAMQREHAQGLCREDAECCVIGEVILAQGVGVQWA